MKPRSIVMVAGDGESTRLIFHALKHAFDIVNVIIETPVSHATLMRRRAKKLGLRKVFGQTLFRALAVPALQRAGRRRIAEILQRHQLERAPIPAEIVTRVDSANDGQVIDLLKGIQPAAVLVNGTRILHKSVLQSIDAPFINTHTGITPLYRGVHGGYWALAAGQRQQCGVTVHLVDEGIDTGNILGQATIEPQPNDTFVTYPYLQTAAAIPILKRVLHDALDQNLKREPAPAGPSRLFSHPTLGEYLKHWVLNGVR
jgi:methionyl-tRNA formyltransferase